MVKILWSGLADNTVGAEALKQMQSMDDIEIVAGITTSPTAIQNVATDQDFRWLYYGHLGIMSINCNDLGDIDAVVNFADVSHFEDVTSLAVRLKKPLINGTTGLSPRQEAMLYDASVRIPVFRGGVFSFEVKKFIDAAVLLMQKKPQDYTLYEKLYQGKSMPSEVSGALLKRACAVNGCEVKTHSEVTLDPNELVCDWRFGKLRCRTEGFAELAQSVLRIAKMMSKRRAIPYYIYDIDDVYADAEHT